MRRLLGLAAALGMLGGASGCHHHNGHVAGICDCDTGYGHACTDYGHAAPVQPLTPHVAPTVLKPEPAARELPRAEPLKEMPKPAEKLPEGK